MLSSIVKATASKLCLGRAFTTLDTSKIAAYEKLFTPETLNTSEFTAKYGRIWENDDLAYFSPRASNYVRDRICFAANTAVTNGENVEYAVDSLKESLKGMLVPPATCSPLLKHYTSFMEKLDNFTDLRNVPDGCKSLFLRKGLEYLYIHPILWNMGHGTTHVSALLSFTPYKIEVTGSADTSPGIITTSSTLTYEYYNMCSAKNDPERYFYLGSDLSGIKNDFLRDSLRCIEKPPKDFRFVEPCELLNAYISHTAHYDRNKIKTPVFLSSEELRENLGPVFLDIWDYGVAKGNPDIGGIGRIFCF